MLPARVLTVCFAGCKNSERIYHREDSKSRKKVALVAEILEAVMLLCFGLSWPMNAYKSFKARTAAGTSWQFIALITAGYVAGIAAKFVSGSINWVLAVYFINMLCLGLNWAVYFRNRKLDATRA